MDWTRVSRILGFWTSAAQGNLSRRYKRRILVPTLQPPSSTPTCFSLITPKQQLPQNNDMLFNKLALIPTAILAFVSVASTIPIATFTLYSKAPTICLPSTFCLLLPRMLGKDLSAETSRSVSYCTDLVTAVHYAKSLPWGAILTANFLQHPQGHYVQV